jgi:hypothetical protein
MHASIQDLRYSVRQLIKSPGFTLTAVISLALGIGATTAVFSVIYAALLDPYPFRAADRIVRMSVRTKAGSVETVNLNVPQIQQLRQVRAIESMLAMDYHAMTMTGRDLPENVNVIGLISNGFDDLGVPALLGRGLLRSDAIDGQDPQPVAVLSYKFWQTHLAGDPQVVGKTLQLDRKNYAIVGVAAPPFKWYSADVYLPLKMTQEPGHFCMFDFRLKPGVSHRAADAALEPLLDQFAREMPKHFPEHFKVQVERLNEWVVRDDGASIQPAVFVPYTVNMSMGTQILVKSLAPPLTLLHAVRSQLTAVDPEQQSYSTTEDLDSWITDGQEWLQEHLAAWIFGLFGGLALALAAVGLYSVVSYTVAQRTNEFGVRMALGAQRSHVLRIVFASTLGSVGSGIGAGLALTLALNRILEQWAKGNSRDPIILLAGALVLSLVSGTACAIPAWHASKVDPMTALRCE